MSLKMTKKKTRLLCEDDVIKVVDKHTNEDGTLDDDISCILEEVNDVVIVGSKETVKNLQVLTRTSGNVPILPVNPLTSNKDRICDTCIKADVCILSNDLYKVVDDIKEISERIGVFINTDIRCQKWRGVL